MSKSGLLTTFILNCILCSLFLVVFVAQYFSLSLWGAVLLSIIGGPTLALLMHRAAFYLGEKQK